jgi:hypothetical protein
VVRIVTTEHAMLTCYFDYHFYTVKKEQDSGIRFTGDNQWSTVLWTLPVCSEYVVVHWICSLFQTMFGERGIVLCLFNLKFFVQLDTLFTYLIWTVFSVVYSVFCIVLWHCTMLCYCFSSVYCTVNSTCTVVSACDVRAATLTEVFPCFFLSFKANARV